VEAAAPGMPGAQDERRYPADVAGTGLAAARSLRPVLGALTAGPLPRGSAAETIGAVAGLLGVEDAASPQGFPG
jgi:hypothetical protein